VVKVITYKSIVLFLFVVVVLKIYQVFDITLFAVLLTVQALMIVVKVARSMEQNGLRVKKLR
jgi:hypothetical protein